METIFGRTIRNTRVSVDDKSFVNCTLSNCTLEYSGGSVSFQATRFTKCRYVFFGHAKRTILFAQETGLMPFDPADWSEFGDAACHPGDGS